jgi:DNA-binding response OmpR family regulator
MALVLVVDDDRDSCRLIERLLSMGGHRVQVFHAAADALHWLSDADPDLVLLHVKPWNGEVLGVLGFLRSRCRSSRVIALTGHPKADNLQKAVRLGVEDCLVQPVEISELEARIEAVLDRAR